MRGPKQPEATKDGNQRTKEFEQRKSACFLSKAARSSLQNWPD